MACTVVPGTELLRFDERSQRRQKSAAAAAAHRRRSRFHATPRVWRRSGSPGIAARERLQSMDASTVFSARFSM